MRNVLFSALVMVAGGSCISLAGGLEWVPMFDSGESLTAANVDQILRPAGFPDQLCGIDRMKIVNHPHLDSDCTVIVGLDRRRSQLIAFHQEGYEDEPHMVLLASRRGAADGQMDFPADLCVVPAPVPIPEKTTVAPWDHFIFIADQGNARVQMWKLRLHYLFSPFERVPDSFACIRSNLFPDSTIVPVSISAFDQLTTTGNPPLCVLDGGRNRLLFCTPIEGVQGVLTADEIGGPDLVLAEVECWTDSAGRRYLAVCGYEETEASLFVFRTNDLSWMPSDFAPLSYYQLPFAVRDVAYSEALGLVVLGANSEVLHYSNYGEYFADTLPYTYLDVTSIAAIRQDLFVSSLPREFFPKLVDKYVDDVCTSITLAGDFVFADIQNVEFDYAINDNLPTDTYRVLFTRYLPGGPESISTWSVGLDYSIGRHSAQYWSATTGQCPPGTHFKVNLERWRNGRRYSTIFGGEGILHPGPNCQLSIPAWDDVYAWAANHIQFQFSVDYPETIPLIELQIYDDLGGSLVASKALYGLVSGSYSETVVIPMEAFDPEAECGHSESFYAVIRGVGRTGFVVERPARRFFVSTKECPDIPDIYDPPFPGKSVVTGGEWRLVGFAVGSQAVLYDVRGRRVGVLVGNGAGTWSLPDTRVAAGVYFVRGKGPDGANMVQRVTFVR